jgi:hypothetical protein
MHGRSQLLREIGIATHRTLGSVNRGLARKANPLWAVVLAQVDVEMRSAVPSPDKRGYRTCGFQVSGYATYHAFLTFGYPV